MLYWIDQNWLQFFLLTWTVIENQSLLDIPSAQAHSLADFRSLHTQRDPNGLNGVQKSVDRVGVSCIVHDGVVIILLSQRSHLVSGQFVEVGLLT